MRAWFRFLSRLSLRGSGDTIWCGVAVTLAALTGMAIGLLAGWLLVAALNAVKAWLGGG